MTTPKTNSSHKFHQTAPLSCQKISFSYLNISQVRTCLNQRRQKGSDNVQYLLVLSIKKVDLIKKYLHQSLSVLNWYLSLIEQFSAIDSLDRKKKKKKVKFARQKIKFRLDTLEWIDQKICYCTWAIKICDQKPIMKYNTQEEFVW